MQMKIKTRNERVHISKFNKLAKSTKSEGGTNKSRISSKTKKIPINNAQPMPKKLYIP